MSDVPTRLKVPLGLEVFAIGITVIAPSSGDFPSAPFWSVKFRIASVSVPTLTTFGASPEETLPILIFPEGPTGP